MAKPIPFNRRWQQNQLAQLEAAEAVPAQPPAETPLPVQEQVQSLIASVHEALSPPAPDEESDPIALVQEYLRASPREVDAVLYARFESRCLGCGEPIRVGDPIRRHPQWGRYVHADCCHRPRAVGFYTVVARYSGQCRRCGQPITPGEQIAYRAGNGWVHAACARRPEGTS
jgi:hypothetical protein